jgi:hypothetical protein
METAKWIAGLMAENYEALGFIPDTTLRDRYIARHRYILQSDERGRPVGYLLHGALNYGQSVVISQACIQYEKQMRGYGEAAFSELLHRAKWAGASSIHLRCADGLPASKFWQSLGFQILGVEPGGATRNRLIIKMAYPLLLPLFTASPVASYCRVFRTGPYHQLSSTLK